MRILKTIYRFIKKRIGNSPSSYIVEGSVVFGEYKFKPKAEIKLYENTK